MTGKDNQIKLRKILSDENNTEKNGGLVWKKLVADL